MKNVRAYHIYTLVLTALLAGCAGGASTPPPGGPPDEVPPIIIRTEPADGTTLFAGDAITVEFDEYVEEGSVQEQVVITPLPNKPPDFSWSGSALEIEFQEPLLPDRTYAITFGAGIADLSGNRLSKPFTIRFSTGAEIDSGRIQGMVLDAAGKRNLFIYAYSADTPERIDTLHADKTQPDFITPVGDSGTFSVEALPPGTYRLFAIADEFSDRLYSPETDAFGVAPYDVVVDSVPRPATSLTGLTIRLRPGPIDIIAPSLYTASPINSSRTEIRFSEPIDTAALIPTNFTLRSASSAKEYSVTSAWRSPNNALAVLLVHVAVPEGNEIQVTTQNLRDTVGNPLPDSVAATSLIPNGTTDALPPVLGCSLDSNATYTFPDSIPFWFDEAVTATNTKGAINLRDMLGSSIEFRVQRRSPAAFVAYPLDTVATFDSGILSIDLRYFVDLAGNHKDSVARIPLRIAPAIQPGTIQGSIKDAAHTNGRYVVLVNQAKGDVVVMRRQVTEGVWEINGLPKGEYRIRVFRDTNSDGVYDYGSIVPYKPSEQVVEWETPVTVRPRWTTNNINIVFPAR